MLKIGSDPGRLLSSDALTIKQIDRAIELEEDPAQSLKFLGHLLANRKWLRGNPPLVAEKQPVRGNAIPDEAGTFGRTHDLGLGEHRDNDEFLNHNDERMTNSKCRLPKHKAQSRARQQAALGIRHYGLFSHYGLEIRHSYPEG